MHLGIRKGVGCPEGDICCISKVCVQETNGLKEESVVWGQCCGSARKTGRKC